MSCWFSILFIHRLLLFPLLLLPGLSPTEASDEAVHRAADHERAGIPTPVTGARIQCKVGAKSYADAVTDCGQRCLELLPSGSYPKPCCMGAKSNKKAGAAKPKYGYCYCCAPNTCISQNNPTTTCPATNDNCKALYMGGFTCADSASIPTYVHEKNEK